MNTIYYIIIFLIGVGVSYLVYLLIRILRTIKKIKKTYQVIRRHNNQTKPILKDLWNNPEFQKLYNDTKS